MKIKTMDVLLGLSYGIGLLLIATAITIYWSDGSVSLALWTLVSGVIWLALTGGFQTQKIIWKASETEPRPADAAYVSVVDGDVAHTIGSPPTVALVVRNTGQTEARNVTWRATFAVAPVDAEIPLDRTRVAPSTVLAPGGTLSYRYTFETWNPQWDALLKAETFAIIAVGEINYQDRYGNYWPSTYRFISGGAFGRSTGIAPGKFGIAPNAPENPEIEHRHVGATISWPPPIVK
jgi:hypothetical protein